MQQVTRLFARFEWTSVIDILILALLIYGLLSILQGTRAEILFRGVIILLLAGFVVNSIWPSQLPVLKWLVSNSLQFVLLAILVIFAPEMRRALEQIGHTGDFINRPLGHRTQDATLVMIEEVVAAAVYLSNQRWGGLIIIERTTGLQDIANKGVALNAEVSSALLGNIFVPNTPLHDGAVIIRQNQIVAAACVLPLSDNLGKNEHFGTRHKAAVGITEQSDAVAVVVSEETGKISIANNGRLYPKLSRDRVRDLLLTLLLPNIRRQERRTGRTGLLPRTPSNGTNGHTLAAPAKSELSADSEQIILKNGEHGDETRRAIIQGKPANGNGPNPKNEEQVSAERRENS